MKTVLFKYIIICLAVLLYASSHVFAQQASLVILKNGKNIDPNDMSISRGDKLTFQVLNKEPGVKYRISEMYLEVRTQQYQQIKSMQQAAKYHKVYTLSTGFENSPKIEVKASDYINKYVSRLLFKFVNVEQLKNNETTKVNWITYGKEYEFWYY